ncbi:AmmeMemoRadiSam system protein B [bacterium]|nr:AmmeMemoRadiSam system protein B [bacterium]
MSIKQNSVFYYLIVLLVGVCLLPAWGCNSRGQGREVREPSVAGSFYPASPAELEQLVDKYIKEADAAVIKGRPVALLVPHAGYVFSGAVAATALKTIAGMDLDTIYVIGTAHHADRSGALTWQGQAFRTPLGEYPVDDRAVRELIRKCPDIRSWPAAWPREHSVEVVIPFLQKLAPRAKLVPLLMGACSGRECRSVARAVARQAGERQAVIIASADLSHYPSWQDAIRVDQAMIAGMLSMEPKNLDRINQEWMSRGIDQLACTMCGLSAVKTIIMAGKELGANQAELLQYINSGDISRDKSRVVGYAAMVFFKEADSVLAKEKTVSPGDSGEELSPSRQAALLDMARSAVVQTLEKGRPVNPEKPPEWLLEKRAIFVTFKTGSRLRGCIGMTEPRLPLYQAITQMACAAAFQDTRFQPLTFEELPNIDIEISILSPLRRVQDAKKIIMGKHGVVVRAERRLGLFLPQVAQETGWSRKEFLNVLCSQKAGLARDAWQDPETEIYTFTVQSFQEPFQPAEQ